MQLDISDSQPRFYKINNMSEMVKFNLPKVRLRVKTTLSESLPLDKQAHQFSEYATGKCVFQERTRMKKEIQEAYLRSRKRHKNNYRKPFKSIKKHESINPEDNQSSILIKHRTSSVLNRLEFTLEVDSAMGSQSELAGKTENKERLLTCFSSNNKNGRPRVRQSMLGVYKERHRPILLFKNASLHKPEQEGQYQEGPIELSGKKLECLKFDRPKQVFQPLNLPKPKQIRREVNRISNVFRIDPWRAESINRLKQYFDEERL